MSKYTEMLEQLRSYMCKGCNGLGANPVAGSTELYKCGNCGGTGFHWGHLPKLKKP